MFITATMVHQLLMSNWQLMKIFVWPPCSPCYFRFYSNTPSIHQNTITVTTLVYLLKIYYFTTFQDPILRGITAALTSQICTSAKLLLLSVGNPKLRGYDGLQSHSSHTEFCKNQMVHNLKDSMVISYFYFFL